MRNWRTVLRFTLLTLSALLCFAGNSLLCRLALRDERIDPVSFTTIRIVAGAATLFFFVRCSWPIGRRRLGIPGSWLSALALQAYAAGFSLAYTQLAAATGAMLLFGAVQVTMIGHALRAGEGLIGSQRIGLCVAIAGLVSLLMPGMATPASSRSPLAGALLMLTAGFAWGVYSLRGKNAGDPLQATAGNFIRAVPMAMATSLAMGLAFNWRVNFDAAGAGYAVLSGALTSGIGYAIWYSVLPGLRGTTASIVQLSVPVIAALGGVALLGEPLSTRLVASSTAILIGISLVISNRRP